MFIQVMSCPFRPQARENSTRCKLQGPRGRKRRFAFFTSSALQAIVLTPVYRRREGEEPVFVRRTREVPFTETKIVIRLDEPPAAPRSLMNMRLGIVAHRVFRRSQSASNIKTLSRAGPKLLPRPSICVVPFRICDLKHNAKRELTQCRIAKRYLLSHFRFRFIRVGQIFFERG